MRTLLLALPFLIAAMPAAAQDRLSRGAFLNRCESAVLDRGYRVREMYNYERLRDGQRVSMTVQRRDDRQRVRCGLRDGSRTVSLAGFERDDDRRRPSTREVARACIDQINAARRGFRVGDIIDRAEYRDRMSLTFAARRDGRAWVIDCTYGYRDGRIALDTRRR